MQPLKVSNTGSWISVLIGGVTGLLTIAIVFFGSIILTELITDETLSALAIFALYSHPTLAVSIALLPTLWITGRIAEKSILRQRSLLKSSFQYSLLTNLVIWTVFTIVYCLSPLYFALSLLLPLGLFLTGTLISTFTISLFICYRIRKRTLLRATV